MPLIDLNATKKIELSTPGEFIEVNIGLTVKNYRQAVREASKYQGDGPDDTPLYLAVIKSWCIKGADGEIAPLNEASLALISIPDLNIIDKALIELYVPKA